MITLSLNSENEVLSENDEPLQSNGGSDGVKYLTMIEPRGLGQPAQSSNCGSATGAKYLTIVGAKDSGQSPQLSAWDLEQLPQSSNVGTVGYMKLLFTQSQPGLGDEEYMGLDKESQLHASTVHDDNTYQPLLQQSRLPNSDDYMKVDKHFNTYS